MRITILVLLAFSLSACIETGDTTTNITEVIGTYIGDGAYYVEQNADGTITSCTVSESNDICSDEELQEVVEIIESV